jgi:hypothetical protein
VLYFLPFENEATLIVISFLINQKKETETLCGMCREYKKKSKTCSIYDSTNAWRDNVF